jgi:hypothetical protein
MSPPQHILESSRRYRDSRRKLDTPALVLAGAALGAWSPSAAHPFPRATIHVHRLNGSLSKAGSGSDAAYSSSAPPSPAARPPPSPRSRSSSPSETEAGLAPPPAAPGSAAAPDAAPASAPTAARPAPASAKGSGVASDSAAGPGSGRAPPGGSPAACNRPSLIQSQHAGPPVWPRILSSEA